MSKLIIANWKSNKSPTEVVAWFERVQQQATEIDLTTVTPIVAPAFSLLSAASQPVQELGWQLAAQDLSPFPAGSYTGAVSARNIQELGVKYVLVGHSERRRYFGETAAEIARKVEQALENAFTPIVCVDEQSLVPQAEALTPALAKQCVVAYEPAAAIGTGNNASLETVKAFRTQVEERFGAVPFVYGGSVNEQTTGEYLLVTDGVLIGTASLDATQFLQVLQSALGKTPATG